MADSRAEPNGLDPDEMQTWLAVISMIVRLPAALDAQLRRDADITHFDYLLLAVLSGADQDTMRMSELARMSDSSLSRLSHAVKRLEQRGWIRRAVDPDDGRSILATLTATGRVKLEATAPGHVATVRRHLFDPLSGRQLIELRRIANRINDSIEPGVGPDMPDSRTRSNSPVESD